MVIHTTLEKAEARRRYDDLMIKQAETDERLKAARAAINLEIMPDSYRIRSMIMFLDLKTEWLRTQMAIDALRTILS